jgi:hypothetical protein
MLYTDIHVIHRHTCYTHRIPTFPSQANWIDAVKEHLGTPNIKWKLYDHKLFGLRCCAECSHPDHCPLSAANGVDVGRYIDKEWQRIISSQCPRSSVLDIWRMTEALAKVGYPPSADHFFCFLFSPASLNCCEFKKMCFGRERVTCPISGAVHIMFQGTFCCEPTLFTAAALS